MVKVSIIIPVYKAEDYLEQCINSCLNQTMKDIEIILINDASPDNSGKIMKRYSEIYPEKIISIFLKENIRQGGARNRGIEIAKGEYLCFVDADDYIDETMCEKLYSLCIKDGLDIVSTNGYRIQNGRLMYFNVFKPYDFSRKKSVIHFTTQCYLLIKREIIQKNNLLYPLHLYHEDTSVVPLWYMSATKKALLNEPLYFRRVHSGSTTQSLDIDGISHILKALEVLVENAKRVRLYNGYDKTLLDDFIFNRIVSAAKTFLKRKEMYKGKDLTPLQNAVGKWGNYNFDETLFFNHISRMDYILGMEFIKKFDTFMNRSWEQYCSDNKRTGYPDRKNKIMQLVNKIQEQKKDMVIWGAGQKGIPIITMIKSWGAKYFVGDNNNELWDKKTESGDVVRNSEWIKSNVENPVFLITVGEYYGDIINSLEQIFESVTAIDIFAYLQYNLAVNEVLMP
ncbi:MAG: glycosyltransferase [Lachnospiraceae bacterium]|nr:glycosyltransferase [Lachnospiraceae bacterium]